MQPKSVKAAIVGCGRMAGTIDDEVRDFPGMLFPYGHAGAYKEAEGVDLVAAADLDADRLQSFCDRFGIPGRFNDVAEMVETARPDIVSVTTPATARAPILTLLAERGVRAIYSEKALACSMAETDAIGRALEGAGTAFNIGTSRRYGPGYRAAREFIASGEIGTPHLAVAYAPGALMHTHSHTVDTLLFLLGDPEVEEVQARLTTPPDQVVGRRFPGDPSVEWAQLRCKGGIRATIQSAPGRYEFEVIGSKGAVLAFNNGYAKTWRVRRPNPAHPRYAWAWEEQPFPAITDDTSATLRAVTELADAVRSGVPTSGGFEIARRQMEALIAIAESHLAGGAAVKLPLERDDLYIPSR